MTVAGKLEPMGSVQSIQMPVGGIASNILVKDGDKVKAGQVVMQLDAETTKQRLDSLTESKKFVTLQLEHKKTELDQYLLFNDEELKTLTRNLDLQEIILEKFETLKKLGASSELQYLQQLNTVSELTGKIQQLKVDRLRQEAIQRQQIQQIKTELENLTSNITEASVNLKYQVLKSPVDGVVFDLQPKGKGYVAQSTESIMKVVPYRNLEAKVEIPSNQIGFVRVGMPADLSIDSFPATDFGVLEG